MMGRIVDTTGRLLGREPAQWAGLTSAVLILLSETVLPMTVHRQGAVNAVVVAVVGVMTAAAVSAERAAPFVAGLAQAVIACALAFGVELSPEVQASVMAVVAPAVALWLRTQVVAPVAAPEVSGRHALRPVP